jgi:hypothetical protein
MNHSLTTHYFTVNFNIILPYTPSSHKCCIPSGVYTTALDAVILNDVASSLVNDVSRYVVIIYLLNSSFSILQVCIQCTSLLEHR